LLTERHRVPYTDNYWPSRVTSTLSITPDVSVVATLSATRHTDDRRSSLAGVSNPSETRAQQTPRRNSLALHPDLRPQGKIVHVPFIRRGVDFGLKSRDIGWSSPILAGDSWSITGGIGAEAVTQTPSYDRRTGESFSLGNPSVFLNQFFWQFKRYDFRVGAIHEEPRDVRGGRTAELISPIQTEVKQKRRDRPHDPAAIKFRLEVFPRNSYRNRSHSRGRSRARLCVSVHNSGLPRRLSQSSAILAEGLIRRLCWGPTQRSSSGG
jgi:hypothetical protein